jgi:hypothetical protein
MPGGIQRAGRRAAVAALVLWAGAPAAAQDTAREAPEAATREAAQPAKADPTLGLTFRGRLEWLSAAQATSPRDTAVNPQNAVLRVPQVSAQSELRPDLRLERGADLQLVARPRLLLQGSKARAAGVWQEEARDATVTWLELFGAWRVDDRLAVAYGLQNFQWGPAELLSPSNRLFHETGFTRDPLYAVRGKHLVRVNLSSGQALTAVLLAEVEPSGEAPFVAGAPFDRKAEAKLEWASPSGRGYLGLTGGAGQVSRGFFGEYGALSLTDGLSVYADAVHQAGSEAWVPVELPGGAAGFAQAGRLRGLRTLAVGGVRYTFAGGADLRFEYVFDEAGWDRSRLALANRAAAPGAAPPGSPEAQASVLAWLSPGFELVGRQLAYASLSLTELPPGKRTRLQARVLAALEDGSAAAFVTASHDATDAVVVFVSLGGADGARDAALSRLVRGMALAGAVVSW